MKDKRVKVNLNYVFGKVIMLGEVKNNYLMLTLDKKTVTFSKTKVRKAVTLNDYPNPTEKQKRDPDYVYNSSNIKEKTSLHFAAEDGDLQLVKELIKKGADINAKAIISEPHKIRSLTPLDFAYGATELDRPYVANSKNKETIEFLESKDAIFGTIKLPGLPKRSKGYLAEDLKNAISNRDFYGVGKLIEKGADVNSVYKDESGKTALMLNLFDAQITRVLLAAGADPNIAAGSETALQQAVMYSNNIITVRLLLAYGADINTKWFTGQTPLELAEMFNHKDMADLIKKYSGLSDK